MTFARGKSTLDKLIQPLKITGTSRMKEIHLWGVKQNNLKNIEVKIPVGQLTVVCGPSGSGKSSLALL